MHPFVLVPVFDGVYLVRVHLYVLLPISIVGALVLVALGVPQTLAGAVDASTLEGAKQTISLGPVASQEIIKELGTNGGGFFNVNSGHPYENPSPLTDLITNFAIIVIPAAMFVTNDTPSTSAPAARAAIVSCTVDIPTRSAPTVRNIRISAGVS